MKRRDLMRRLAKIAKTPGVVMHLTEGSSHTKGHHRRPHRCSAAPHRDQRDDSQGDHPQTGGTTMRVTATATRTGQWWAIEVPDVAGGLHTQARRLDQIASAVADAVALVADVSPDTIEVVVIPKVPQADAELIEAARDASLEAASAAERASRLSRQVVEQLRAEGMTVRDVGGLLGVSPQRVSQLVETAPATTDQAQAS
jgi:hypothetical protein